MRILLVEDDHKIAAAIKKGLMQETYAVDTAFDGDEGYDLAASEAYDVIILDRLLPNRDGIAICQALRKENNHTPVLLLTAKGQVSDRVEGLNAGADDYLVKPFAFEELLARIRALARRPKQTLTPALVVADLTLDTITFSVKRGSTPIQLSHKEFALLEYLMRHKNQLLTKDMIMARVWDYEADILPNTVEVYIGYLRNKIDRPFASAKPLLETVRGFGYKISDE